jgi:tryptophan-rich sensory protein
MDAAVHADGHFRLAGLALATTEPGALVSFGVQLAVNALWSWLFFAWHRGALAAMEVLVLLALIVATVRAFWPSSRLAAILLVPYLLWVGFASALTWSVWQRNPGVL